MKNLLKKLPSSVQFIILCYGTGMLVFSFFRLLLLALHLNEVKEIPTTVIFQSLLMGLRFDAVMNGYLLILPAFIFFVFSFFRGKEFLPKNFISAFIVIVYSITFFIHVSDIRWFSHGAARLTASVLQWTDTPGWMLKFIFQDVYNYPFLILFFVLIFLFNRLIRRIKVFSFQNSREEIRFTKTIPVYLILLGLMFIGIRGRLAMKSPIRWGTAFFSQYNFANQLGLNPVYTFMRSALDKNENQNIRYDFMSDTEAEKIVRGNLGAENADTSVSPVARKVIAQGNPHRYNVVLVLMESMSAKNMKRFGNEGDLTPMLDSLFDHSISFSNFYSDGNHTFNGIYSSLFGFHSLPMVHHMKDLAHQQPYEGLANVLLSQGYNTTFFTTHDEQFDNMAGFLLPNGFQKIIAEKDYPAKEVKSTLGVPDHVMFERAVEEMDNMKKKNEPFLIALMTGSNHEPFVLPNNISLNTHSSALAQKMVEYADWSVGKFLSDASTHSWFDSTIFIFTGDHGGLIAGFDHYLAFHHIPLIIYAPKVFPTSKIIVNVGGQADIFATTCGLLNISYTNNSMGVDLINSQRNLFPFCYDEELCCLTADNFFAINHGHERFYKIFSDKKNVAEAEKTSLADSMKTFLRATMQVTQRMIEERKMK